MELDPNEVDRVDLVIGRGNPGVTPGLPYVVMHRQHRALPAALSDLRDLPRLGLAPLFMARLGRFHFDYTTSSLQS